MSKLIENIKAELTGNKKSLLPPLIKVRESIQESDIPRTSVFDIGYEYKVGIEWGFKAFLENSKMAEEAVENCAKSFRESMYGDIREQVLALERAVLENDRNEALKQMRDIMREIFG